MSFSFEIHLIELGFCQKRQRTSGEKLSNGVRGWQEINFQNPFFYAAAAARNPFGFNLAGKSVKHFMLSH